MSTSLMVRCMKCDTFAEKAGTCKVCGSTDLWEKVVVDDTPVEMREVEKRQLNAKGEEVVVLVAVPVEQDVYVHRTGVRFFAYEAAAAEAPDFAVEKAPPAPPTLEERLAALEAAVFG